MADTPYYTASTLRSRVGTDLENSAKFPDADLTDLIAEYEDVAERYRGCAFTSRAAVSETHTLNQARCIVVRWPFVRSVTSIAVVARDGTSTSLVSTDWEINSDPGIVDLGGSYTGRATIVYTHYLTATPNATVLRGCREFVRSSMLRQTSGMGRDVIRQGFEGGGSTQYSTPNWVEGRPTGYLTVDAILNSLTDYRRPGVA